MLEQNQESRQLVIFSEIVQMYNTNLTATEMIILITKKSIFLLDSLCKFKSRHDLASLSDIILLKASPSFFALSFMHGQAPLILESFRRAELMFFTLSMREHATVKPKLVKDDGMKL